MTRAVILSRKLASKTIAVGSGKGGTGKSTTALNLALYYGKRGIRTALFDLDPLSNAGVILDVSIPREILDFPIGPEGRLDDYRYPVFPGFDLIFPGSAQKRHKSSVLRDLLFGKFSNEIDRRYEILILDLPAGIGNDENLAFLPFVDTLLWLRIRNPQPTSPPAGTSKPQWRSTTNSTSASGTTATGSTRPSTSIPAM
jgi:flagellar biosynthesis protein FlhG